MSEAAHSDSSEQPPDIGCLKLTPASEVERPTLTSATEANCLALIPTAEVSRPTLTPAAEAMDEEPNEQPLILAKGSHAAIPPPPILGGPSGWRRSEIVDAAPRWQDRELEKAKKKKKSRWIATRDCVLPTESFDEHTKDTMMKSGLYTWIVGSANESCDK